MLAVILIVVLVSSGSQTLTLNVYNWGEYISDGSDDSLDTIKAFEQWYYETYGVKVKVNYSTYASNEDMYAKLSSGAVSFDVVIPSDYMIARMASEDMLLPLDFDNIPNYQYIDESFRGLYYDPDDMYSIPYTYGVIGVIYNANVVDETDAKGWELMWNDKYAGDILQFNNSRDAFATAQYMLGLNVNSDDHSEWEQALAKLKEQRPLVKSYVMDEIYNMMESGEAAIGAYYAGDYFTMLDAEADDVDLRFYYPERTNYFIDAMCIPSCCQNKELAEIFINYMLSAEPAIANAEYIYYASPNSLVYEDEGYQDDLGEEAMEILYPEIEDFSALYNEYAYRNLDLDMLDFVNTLWETLKISLYRVILRLYAAGEFLYTYKINTFHPIHGLYFSAAIVYHTRGLQAPVQLGGARLRGRRRGGGRDGSPVQNRRTVPRHRHNGHQHPHNERPEGHPAQPHKAPRNRLCHRLRLRRFFLLPRGSAPPDHRLHPQTRELR